MRANTPARHFARFEDIAFTQGDEPVTIGILNGP